MACDISCIDVNYIRPRLACSYLIECNGKAAFIDCGTSHSVARLRTALAQRDLTANDVQYVVPTHVHLDHAGGASALMQIFPKATLVVHPRGARHLINPEKLVESTKQVYGEQKFASLYGEIVPIDAERVITPDDESTIDLNGRSLKILDTPGHARHHICIYDELSNGWFTGDTFGLSYPDIDSHSAHYLMPTTTPVQFEPLAWENSIQRMLAFKPSKMYLTHFGMVENVEFLASKLLKDIHVYTELAQSCIEDENRLQSITQAITEFTIRDLRSNGNQQSENEIMSLLKNDIILNAQGLEVWLTRLEKTNKSE